MPADKTLELAMQLIARPSVTPNDAGCQELIAARLAAIGFRTESLRFGEVVNLWAERGGGEPLVVFAGHTDVVPTGPREQWTSDPFVPTLRGDHLYGRGAADMKSSLAAFVTAIEDFVARHPRHRGAIALLITADEEGPSVDGTVKVVEWLRARGRRITHCVVGEPTCVAQLGDVVKNGRRGSLNGKLRIRGVQGHVAYPHLARNPVHVLAPALSELVATEWDRGNRDFPPTSFQVSNIHAGTGAENVIPGVLDIDFNFRFSTAVTEIELRERVERVLTRHGVDHEIQWRLSGQPYLTAPGRLVEATREAIRAVLGIEPRLSTDGGTSDGRFIAPLGAEVVEFGPLNASIHKIDERVAAADPARLAQVYARLLENLLA